MNNYLGLDHVQVSGPRGNDELAIEFYEGLLGFRQIEKPESLKSRGGAWFEIGNNQQLHFGVEDDFHPAEKAHPAFRVQSLERLKRLLKEKNYDYAVDNLLPHANRIFVNDPFGNRLEFMELK
ncbi:VOC family protein [Macrococcus capreoli]|uniref:VOC family protein n=1 Tax=Macrococcus capreoli TaxID=2982690 RepID=UPI0021D608A0|nr:VOC family protein [Macrococcus sp. TMW 2.2395]MCU7557676.1 VOC family protein [Macrococcus sp. TMW 2.2395]